MPSHPVSAGESCKIFILYTVDQPNIAIGLCVPRNQFFQLIIFDITIQITEYRLGSGNTCTDSSLWINPCKAELYSCVCSTSCSIISTMAECIIEVLYSFLNLPISD